MKVILFIVVLLLLEIYYMYALDPDFLLAINPNALDSCNKIMTEVQSLKTTMTELTTVVKTVEGYQKSFESSLAEIKEALLKPSIGNV